jgi:hypothetical protein
MLAWTAAPRNFNSSVHEERWADAVKRAFTFAACVVVGVTLVGSLRVSGQTKDPRIGRWQLNLSKSKFTGTPPKSITRLYEDRGGGIVLYTGTAVTPTGTNVTLVLYKLDGKEYPQVPRDAETMTAVSQRLVDAHTIEAVTKANGTVVSTFTQVVSADGKTLTYTPKDAQGKATGVVQVFDRQSTT